jgi:urate oxidase
MFDYIKELGFKTFENYMLIQDYAYLPNETDRLDAIVLNTKYFLENCNLYKDNIEQDIQHNYDLFFKLAEQNIEILNSIRDTYSIEQTELDKWFNQKGFGHLVRAYD